MKRLMILLMMLAISSAASMADPANAGPINKRQHTQKDRIEQGIRSGSLTKHEAKVLTKQQMQFNRKEQAYRSDGQLTPRERYDLQTDQNQLSRQIYVKKHNPAERQEK